MKKILIVTFIFLSFKFGVAQETHKDYQKVVSSFIDCIKNADKTKLSTQISFPLKREYPIPSIKNAREFIDRYDEIFDENFITKIINSDPETDWGTVGWRGIMLFNGDLWLDTDGKLTAVNYQSEVEKKIKVKLLKNDKINLHHSLAEFEKPVLIIETNKFKIRIDELENGNFRYASWPIDSKMTEKPSLILTKGMQFFEGSGGNHRYEFENGIYKYICRIEAMGRPVTAELKVYKGEKEILSQAGKLTERENIKENTTSPKLDTDDFLIRENSVGIFKIDDALPFSNAPSTYKVRKVIKTQMEEGIAYDYTNYILSEQNKDLLISTEYEMMILSEKFKTAKGIGVNSTIEEFIKQYPDYSIWYTYVSERYIIQAKGLNTQFILSEMDFKSELNVTSDQTILKKSDFKENAKIIKIRMYN